MLQTVKKGFTLLISETLWPETLATLFILSLSALYPVTSMLSLCSPVGKDAEMFCRYSPPTSFVEF